MIQFQRLLDVAKATELEVLGRFEMETVVSDCGTAGCMIGNYNAYAGRRLGTFEHGDHRHFGITKAEYWWLFDQLAFVGGWRSKERCLTYTTKEEALRRLRKFIYYKLHKHEMCYDEKYGVSERSRQAEGDHNFAQTALAKQDLVTV